jgi:dihydroanticapsin dehydrogenase
MRLEDKIALVTGAAMGIGEAIAALFAEEGASVVLLDKDPSGEAVAQRLPRAEFIQADISREDEVREAFARTERIHGRLDVLVNNAVEFGFKGLEATPSDWRRVLDVNVVGTSLCSRYGADVMKKNGGGSIVHLASISGLVAQPGQLTYSASKAALIQMTRSMALDLARFNIRVNCVCPGYVRTSATDRYLERTRMSEEAYTARFGALHLLNRVGTPREVAYAVLFLASDESSFVTATSLMVDGGYIAR